MFVNALDEIEIPLYADRMLEVGAVSLVLYYPQGLVDITDVRINGGNPAGLRFNDMNGELRIGWYSTSAVIASETIPLAYIKVRATGLNAMNLGELAFSLGGMSEIANAVAEVQTAGLIIPKLQLQQSEFYVNLFPNPARDAAYFEICLPEQAQLTLIIHDLPGKEIMRLSDNRSLDAGVNRIEFDASSLTQGIYYYRIIAVSKGNEREISGKLLINR
jgi:hypothetical protein